MVLLSVYISSISLGKLHIKFCGNSGSDVSIVEDLIENIQKLQDVDLNSF